MVLPGNVELIVNDKKGSQLHVAGGMAVKRIIIGAVAVLGISMGSVQRRLGKGSSSVPATGARRHDGRGGRRSAQRAATGEPR